MAGQRASSVTGDAAAPRPRGRTRGRAALPGPRRAADGAGAGRVGARARARAKYRAHCRARRLTSGQVLTVSLGLPVVGALADELRGSAPAGIFGVLTVAGAAAGAWLATRAGWWWVVSAIAPVVLATTAGVELLAQGERYGDAKALAAGAARWAVQGFPVMITAMAAAGAAIGLRVLCERRSRPRRVLGADGDRA
ncbi:hypothetical protein [Kitasatospora acidiphila]|uniref:hypothetical protein n=1 Tax=Kitasatospora acidiphila TaxID=2567942 RepID=UPI003C7248C2